MSAKQDIERLINISRKYNVKFCELLYKYAKLKEASAMELDAIELLEKHYAEERK